MAEVFISYKREDKPFAEALANALAAQGVRVWWDVDLLPGDRFSDEITSVIKQAKLAVVLWSERSTTSHWVRAEARAALDQDKLLPARLDDVAIPLPFNDLHTMDLRGWAPPTSDQRLDQLVRIILQRIEAQGARALSTDDARKNLHDHDQEAKFWAAINGSAPASREELQIYLKRFPNGLFTEIAQLRLDQAKRQRFRLRPVAIAGALAALLAPLTIVFGLIEDFPGVARVLTGPPAETQEDTATPDPAPAPAETQIAATLVQSQEVQTAADAFLNIARPADAPPIFIENIFEEPDPRISPGTRDANRTRILDYLAGLLTDGSDATLDPARVSTIAVERAMAILERRYRTGLPRGMREVTPLPAPPLRRIIQHANPYTNEPWQDPNDFTCRDQGPFLQYHRTYVELLLLYRALYLSSFGFDVVFVQNVGTFYAEPQQIASDTYPDVPTPFAATTLRIDAFLQPAALDVITPALLTQLQRLDPDWRKRLSMFAAYTLEYKDAYDRLTADIPGQTRFDSTYPRQVLDDVPNPFGCTRTSGQRFGYTFAFECSDFDGTCSPDHFFGLGRTAQAPRSDDWPGLHQGILLMWHRRTLAGTAEPLANLLEDIARLSSRRSLSYDDIDQALANGRRN